jgi:hypothetical protein
MQSGTAIAFIGFAVPRYGARLGSSAITRKVY